MEIQNFFNTMIEKTSIPYQKIPTDLKRNYLNSRTLSAKQATWIRDALIRNRDLRGLEVPDEIQEEINIALDIVSPADDETVEIDVYAIISEEMNKAVDKIMKRINA